MSTLSVLCIVTMFCATVISAAPSVSEQRQEANYPVKYQPDSESAKASESEDLSPAESHHVGYSLGHGGYGGWGGHGGWGGYGGYGGGYGGYGGGYIGKSYGGYGGYGHGIGVGYSIGYSHPVYYGGHYGKHGHGWW